MEEKYMRQMDVRQEDIDRYNEEPVYYCKKCLSLNIRQIPDDSHQDYCDDCGGTDIETANIFEWEDMYIKRYGKKFLEI